MLRSAAMKLLGTLILVMSFYPMGGARAVEVIKFGTLAPEASPWGQVFKVWADAVQQKSGGALQLQFFFNGTQGDEAAMVAKMKAGQLDGAAVTAVGLGKIYRPILALELPGLFTTWSKLDAARTALKPQLEKGATDAGFTILGWGDVGARHLFSKGFQVKTPDDLKGKNPYLWRDDDAQPFLYQAIGGITPVPLNVPEVLPKLNTGAVNVVIAGALAAEQLQWTSKLDTVSEDISGMAIGAIVISSKRLAGLSDAQRTIVTGTASLAASALTSRIRAQDDASFAKVKGKMTVVTLSADQKGKWDALYTQVRKRLQQGVFPAALVNQLEALAK
jgi:TRAP-type C4-dicarboxylate transport system substrate-binding protein